VLLVPNGHYETEYALSPTSIPRSAGVGHSVTLETILSRDHCLDRPFSALHRYKVALALASSHLRLHPTQWLGDNWNADDIVFLLSRESPGLDQPYLRRTSTRILTSPVTWYKI
jgi:hypothetical protein